MFFTIYKITNKINYKFYIGKHKTNNLNDGYMGSGKLIRRAIEKYGLDNFEKTILHIFDNEKDMNDKEKELVLLSEESYNLCPGGQGGFGFINNNSLNVPIHKQNVDDKKRRSLISIGMKKAWTNGKYDDINFGVNGFLGKKHSEETKNKMRKSKNVGSNNSQYGTMWITNGIENKKIKKENIDTYIFLGYYKGRI